MEELRQTQAGPCTSAVWSGRTNTRRIELADLTVAHYELMRDDPTDGAYSAAAKIMAALIAMPVLTSEDVSDRFQLSTSSAYAALDRLHGAGVLRPLTNRKREQVWGAGRVLDKLDALGARIKKAAT